MTNLTSSSGNKPQGWFFPRWAAAHMGSSFVASAQRSWVAPVIFSAFFLITEPRIGDEIFLVFFVSLLVASVVSFLFSVVVYPFLQLAFRAVLHNATSGKEIAMIMLPLQQLLIWTVAITIALTDYEPVWSPDNPVLLFSLLVSFHAALQLFAYSKRIWKKRHAVLTAQIPTFEHELAATNIEGVPLGFIE